MRRLIYDDPYGNTDREPKLATINENVWVHSEDYWNSHLGNGFAELALYEEQEKVATVVFTKINGFGFHANFQELPFRRGQAKDFFSHDPSTRGGRVARVFMAGETVFIPDYLFIDEERMCEVLSEFFRSGMKLDKDMWIEKKDLHWNIVKGCPI